MDKIRLPKTAATLQREKTKRVLAQKPVPRDELARPIATMTELGAFVRAMRAGLAIGQAELATLRAPTSAASGSSTSSRASRRWRRRKVLRVLLTLGFEIVLAPYDPPPPWMLPERAIFGKMSSEADSNLKDWAVSC